MGIVIIRRVRVVLRTARNTQAFGPAVRSFTGDNSAGITENIADGIGFKTAVRQYIGPRVACCFSDVFSPVRLSAWLRISFSVWVTRLVSELTADASAFFATSPLTPSSALFSAVMDCPCDVRVFPPVRHRPGQRRNSIAGRLDVGFIGDIKNPDGIEPDFTVCRMRIKFEVLPVRAGSRQSGFPVMVCQSVVSVTVLSSYVLSVWPILFWRRISRLIAPETPLAFTTTRYLRWPFSGTGLLLLEKIPGLVLVVRFSRTPAFPSPKSPKVTPAGY